MAKLTLVISPAEMPKHLQLLNPWVQPHYADVIDIVTYDPAHTYNPRQHAVLTHYVDQVEKSAWWQQAQELGLKIIVEHLGDSDVERTSHVNNGILTLRNPNWMWYNATWQWTWHGLDQYRPNRAYQHSFFMPMNLQRWHRDKIIQDLNPVLTEALYSYCVRGRELPGTPPSHISWQGYMNPAWYDSTPFSVVAESYMRSTKINVGLTYRTEVSEKIFKPMLGQQPFVVYGSVDTLAYLKRTGFVTYDNLFDETYDGTLDNRERLDRVTRVVNQAVGEHNYRTFKLDTETLERIGHNHARLFDHATVEQRFRDEVIGDIIEWFDR